MTRQCRKPLSRTWRRRSLVPAGLAMLSLLMPGCLSCAYRPPRGVEPVVRQLTVTAYCNCGKCCNWRRNWYGRAVIASGPREGEPKQIGITASGTRARLGTIAADTSRFPFGTILYVPGYGYGRVEDRGGTITGDHIDLWFPSHRRAERWGRQRLGVKIWLPRGD